MKNIPIVLIVVVLCLSSCKMAEIVVPNDLQNTTKTYDVVGLQKLQWKKNISFGNYSAKETKKSWPSSSQFSMLFTKSKSKHKLQFELNDAAKVLAQVQALYSLETEGFSLDILFPEGGGDIITDSEDQFVGHIYLLENEENWQFSIADISKQSWDEGLGNISNGEETIEVRELIHADKGMIPQTDNGVDVVLGFEFVADQGVIGAVRLYNRGKVWIKEDISPKHKDLIAAMSSALLMRADF